MIRVLGAFATYGLLAACLGTDAPGASLPPDPAVDATGDDPSDTSSGNADGQTNGGASAGGNSGDSGGTGSGDPIAPPTPCAWKADTGSCVRVSGRRLFVNGEAFHVKAIGWNPVPRGGSHPNDLDFAGHAPMDIALMRDASINAVRTYEPLVDLAVLDQLHAAGIYVINTIYPWGGATVAEAVRRVEAVCGHPAILMWLVGNEWNYNHLYTGAQHDLAWTTARVAEVARAVHAADPNHPVATSYGHIPSNEAIQALPEIDVWGANIYAGLSFATLFADFAARSPKPLLVTEYGADAYNSKISREDQKAQADATRFLTNLIFDSSSATVAGGVCIGGALYSWSDEWWKAGDANAHDIGGHAPGAGPYPDSTFNEEYWGIVDIDRKPRMAYDALREVYSSR